LKHFRPVLAFITSTFQKFKYRGRQKEWKTMKKETIVGLEKLLENCPKRGIGKIRVPKNQIIIPLHTIFACRGAYMLAIYSQFMKK
jgi:hypothetical protein